jgi:hypothetical protein
MHFQWILGLALVLRLGVVSAVLFYYPRGWLFSKAPDLGFLAQSLSSGRGLSSPFGGSTGPTAFLAPGYPALLALIFHIFGSYSFASSAALLITQTSFAVLTIAVIMHIAYQLSGPTTANLAGFVWAVSLPLIWIPAIPWETGLSTLLLAGMLDLAMQCVNKAGKGLWILIGGSCGVAMLVNPSLLLALFSMAAWAVYRSRSLSRAGPWLGLLVFVAVYAPWPMRNARVLHAFIPLRSNFGYELWQGNHAGGTGNFDATREPLQNRQEYANYAAIGEVAYMRSKSQIARTYIRAHPGDFVRLSCRRMLRFWTGNGYEVNSGVVAFYASFISLLGLSGLVVLCKQRNTLATLFLLPILLLPLPYYITHPDFRFRLLLDPQLTILSAYAVTQMAAYWKRKRDAS